MRSPAAWKNTLPIPSAMPSQPAQNSASPAPSRFRLIVGLGNPGRQYQATRHNIGFMVLDRLAQKWGVAFTAQAKWDAHVAKTDEFLLLKPQTFMNDSGRAVAACAAFYKIPAEETLVIYDEVALPLGKMRLRPGGSAGGHNGMRSIIAHLGTENFPRLRLGIGGADKSSLSGHVLGKFSAEEKPTVDKLLDRSVEAVIFAALRGWAAAMSAFNAEASPRPPKPTRPATPEENPLPPSPDGTAPSDNSQTPKN